MWHVCSSRYLQVLYITVCIACVHIIGLHCTHTRMHARTHTHTHYRQYCHVLSTQKLLQHYKSCNDCTQPCRMRDVNTHNDFYMLKISCMLAWKGHGECIIGATAGRTVLIVPIQADSCPNQNTIAKCQRNANGNGIERCSLGACAQGSRFIVVLMLVFHLSLS